MNIPYPIAAGVRIAVLSYLGMLLVLALGQRRFIYYPAVAPEDELLSLAEETGLQPWRDSTGELIGWRAPVPDEINTPRLVVFHGNAGLALHRYYFVEGFQSLLMPWEVLLFEYPGYGARSGARPNEKNIMAAAEAALLDLPDDGRPLFLLGESLGSGVAAGLAARQPELVKGIVLITPFTRLADVARRHYPIFPVRLLLRENYNSQEALLAYHGRVAFMIAKNDEVVPAALGEKLYESYGGTKRIWRQSAMHNTLDYTPNAGWWMEVANFLQNRD